MFQKSRWKQLNSTIRRATIRDTRIISNIHASSWKIAYKDIVPQKFLDELEYDFWVSAFQNWIDNNILTAQIIYDNERPVGCITYGRSRDNKLSKWGEIVSVYVLPGYFRKGYGQKLLETALKDLKEEGFQNCYLWVLKENYNARRFYEKMGFD
ncbi:GNAT family N-acetyltransferase [Desulfotomaculum sp. 1211_IL3151]|uniref:GNAT family N-acetyltransferase n=1 Tax=Desulfotomaculum sp. 1211_IL3151 TaxID=3084055 RepID=UPI002FD8FEEB